MKKILTLAHTAKKQVLHSAAPGQMSNANDPMFLTTGRQLFRIFHVAPSPTVDHDLGLLGVQFGSFWRRRSYQCHRGYYI